MEIRFIAHAAFAVEAAGARLICDPWLFGDAFAKGWDLVSPAAFTAAEFRAGDFIWYSHEHPDHFAPAVLKAIPEALRPAITVMYQQTRDRKVIEFCNKLGFATRELAERVELVPGLQVTCGAVPFYDSWLLVEADGVRLLNLNDCVVDGAGARRLRAKIGQIDVLMTQFANAEWVGNPDRGDLRRTRNREIIARTVAQVEALRPTYTVPFASFFYFSHDENCYLNDEVNTVDDAVAALTGRTEVVVLYPGDRWRPGGPHATERARESYRRDYAGRTPKHRPEPAVPFEELAKLAGGCIERCFRHNSAAMIGAAARLRIIPPLRVALTDLGEQVTFSWTDGLRRSSGEVDVETASACLAFVFRFDWGMDTLTVNGRFRASEAGYRRLVRAFAPIVLNNTGRTLSFAALRRGELLDWELARRALRLIAQ